MYNLIMQIFDNSKKDKCDIGIGYDKVAQKIGYTDKLKKAYAFSRSFYNDIIYLRQNGKLDILEKLSEIYDEKDKKAVEVYINWLKDQKKY